MRDRSSVVIIENEKVLLIKRRREDFVYYAFPGGGIEQGETPEEAAKREALEELGVEVIINECISKVKFNGTQYFFRSEIFLGEVRTGRGEEYTDTSRGRGTYEPIWVEIGRLSTLDVRPKEVCAILQKK